MMTRTKLPDDLEYLVWLITEGGFLSPRLIDGGRLWAAIQPKFFTHSISVGRVGDYYGIDTFWCYSTQAEARAALDAWRACGYYGEPTGWHRHPDSGRRVSREAGEIDKDGKVVGAIGVEYLRW